MAFTPTGLTGRTAGDTDASEAIAGVVCTLTHRPVPLFILGLDAKGVQSAREKCVVTGQHWDLDELLLRELSSELRQCRVPDAVIVVQLISGTR